MLLPDSNVSQKSSEIPCLWDEKFIVMAFNRPRHSRKVKQWRREANAFHPIFPIVFATTQASCSFHSTVVRTAAPSITSWLSFFLTTGAVDRRYVMKSPVVITCAVTGGGSADSVKKNPAVSIPVEMV